MSLAQEESVVRPSPFGGALVAAFLRHHAELVGFLARKLGCRATAEDLAQDVFVRLAATPLDVRHARGLIFHTAANLALNHRRDQARRARIRDAAIAPLMEQAETRTPERSVLALDQLRRLARALDGWPARTREVFILNRFDGLTQKQISERLRISHTAVEKAMARAILRLADILADDANG